VRDDIPDHGRVPRYYQVYDADQRPIERVRSLFRGDRFSFVTRLTPRGS
jgi:hypothetical protein